MAYFLAIDCGSQSIRALVFDAQGSLVAKTQHDISQYDSPEPGWAEQHASFLWDALCRVCHQLWDEDRVKPEQITALSVTSQRATSVCVDQQGKALRPVISWTDQRRATELPNMGWWWNSLFRIAGVQPTVDQFLRDCKINWIAQHQPDLLANAHKYLLLSGYFHFQLTGDFRDSVGAQVGYIPFDYKRQQWAKPHDWKWRACPISRDQCPELTPVGQSIGGVSQAASLQTGLPENTPVIASAADKACEITGCGVHQANQAHISYGTTATINGLFNRYIEPIRYLPAYPAALPDSFNTEFQLYRGYWMVSWFKQQFAYEEQQSAAKQSVSAEHLLDRQAAAITPGCNGLLLQPYWSPGIRHPGPEARGTIIGFNESHTRAHLYRAVLEGIAFGLREGRDIIERRSGTRFSGIWLSGGGSQSDVAQQITADVFNLPVHLPKVYETSGLGAAINAAVATGIHGDYSSAMRAMCHERQTIDPNPDNVRLYDEIYGSVYRRVYQRVRPLYRQMQRIFGNP